MAGLLAEFLTETSERLNQLDVNLVRFEQEPNDEEMINAGLPEPSSPSLLGLEGRAGSSRGGGRYGPQGSEGPRGLLDRAPGPEREGRPWRSC
jgi:hypothetical protein